MRRHLLSRPPLVPRDDRLVDAPVPGGVEQLRVVDVGHEQARRDERVQRRQDRRQGRKLGGSDHRLVEGEVLGEGRAPVPDRERRLHRRDVERQLLAVLVGTAPGRRDHDAGLDHRPGIEEIADRGL